MGRALPLPLKQKRCLYIICMDSDFKRWYFMVSKTLKCTVITPLFMTGADGQTPELRPSEIKGMLRFWWRAINGYQSIDSLRKSEAEIFGSSDEKTGKSKFSLKIDYINLEKGDYQPVPTKSFKVQAFKPSQTFNLVLIANLSYDKFKMIYNLLKISLILVVLAKEAGEALEA